MHRERQTKLLLLFVASAIVVWLLWTNRDLILSNPYAAGGAFLSAFLIATGGVLASYGDLPKRYPVLTILVFAGFAFWEITTSFGQLRQSEVDKNADREQAQGLISEIRGERDGLKNERDRLSSTVDRLKPVVTLLEQRYPGVDVDKAVQRLSSEVETLGERLAEQQRRTAPRRISPEVRERWLRTLAPYKGQKVAIVGWPSGGSGEVKAFVDDLTSALNQAGWEAASQMRIPQATLSLNPPAAPIEIRGGLASSEAATELYGQLVAEGHDVRQMENGRGDGLFLWVYPRQ